MRLMIIHLSDIHITCSEDAILSRKEQIVAAIKNLDYELDRCLIAITGDLAQSGTQEQYLIAFEFIASLVDLLKKNLPRKNGKPEVSVEVVAVPGNHDCHLPTDKPDGARINILDSIIKDRKIISDISVQELCLQPQQNFFSFLEAATPYIKAQRISDFDKRISYKYEIEHNNERLFVYCFNTAWMSRRSERQGTLIVPAEVAPTTKEDCALSIALYHHPLNWHVAHEAKLFSKRITTACDIIITGHEHDATRRHIQSDDHGEKFAHVEGGALQQSSDCTNSEFNIFIIDTAIKKQKFATLKWDGNRYALKGEQSIPASENDGAGLVWEDFHINRLRLASDFELSESFRAILQDPGIALTHEKGTLALSDIYLPPDLRETSLSSIAYPRVVHGANILKLVKELPHLLVTGDSQSGKTCFGKATFQIMLNNGYIPLWVSGEEQKLPPGDKIFGYFEDLFLKQYQTNSLTAYRQLDRSQRVIIVDDYDKIRSTAGSKRRLVERLTQFAGIVILLSHDMAQGVDDILHPSAQVLFSRFKIQPFGYQQRDAFIQQWFRLSSEETIESQGLAQKLHEVTRTINIIVGRNFVPAYPVYMLSMLQASEASTPINTGAATHGYFYEVLIKAALLKGRTAREYDIISAYLAHLAYSVFEANQSAFSEADFRRFHDAFQNRHDILRPCEQIRDQLLEQGIIRRRYGDSFEFAYSYFYYYFVASYFKDRLSKDHIRAHIGRLSRALYKSENANILLFLAHLSRDEFLISSLVEASESLYAGVPAARLETDVDFINRLQKVTESIVFEDQGVAALRKKHLEELDRAEEAHQLTDEQLDKLDEERAAADPIALLNSALKTIQIMGQIVKNFPGHLETESKLALSKQCYSLGLRALASMFLLLNENETEIVNQIVSVIRTYHPELREESTKQMAQKSVVGLARLSALGIIKRISFSVGSSELTRTYEKIASEMPFTAIELINTSVALDHSGQFPNSLIEKLSKGLKENSLAYWLLQCLVVNHFHLFPVAHGIKQRICTLLDVKYKPVNFFDEREKLLTLTSKAQSE